MAASVEPRWTSLLRLALGGCWRVLRTLLVLGAALGPAAPPPPEPPKRVEAEDEDGEGEDER